MIGAEPERMAVDSRFRRAKDLPAVCSEEACRELVRRIVHAPTFVRSERLGTLLTYVCDLTLQGRAEEINEQKIGHAVFGRLQDYDSAVDGIVRSQASRLRQRLELYFQREGADEPVRIVIPRGGYVPVFEVQEALVSDPLLAEPAQTIPEIALSAPEPLANARSKTYLRPWLLLSLNLLLVSMLIGLWIHDRRILPPVAVAQQKHPFWSHLFRKDQVTMVVAPDSGLVLFHCLSGQDMDLKGYLDGAYRSEAKGLPQISPSATRKDWLLDLANRRYTSIVDLQAVLSLKDRARSLGSEVNVRYARDLRPNDFKTGTVILLGMSSANPWIELFEQHMNFVLKDDYTRAYWVLNRNPQKGEPARWETLRSDSQRGVFGVVAYMPNVAGDGNALILEGVSMAGTEAASDFVDDDAQLLPFLNQIRKPDGTLPYFELLLGTQNMGASAVRSQILAWRTMN